MDAQGPARMARLRDFVLADPFAGLPDAVMRAAQEAGVRLLLTGYYGEHWPVALSFGPWDMLRDARFNLLATTLRKKFFAQPVAKFRF